MTLPEEEIILQVGGAGFSLTIKTNSPPSSLCHKPPGVLEVCRIRLAIYTDAGEALACGNVCTTTYISLQISPMYLCHIYTL